MAAKNSSSNDKEPARPAADPAAMRRIWVKLFLIVVVIGIWYVQMKYFPKQEVAEGDRQQQPIPEIGPAMPEKAESIPAAGDPEKKSDSEKAGPNETPATVNSSGSRPTTTTLPKSTPKTSPGTSTKTDSNPRDPTTSKTPGTSPQATADKTANNPARPPATTPKATPQATPKSQPKPTGVYLDGKIAHNVVLKNLDDEVIYRGSVDLTKTLERVKQGERLSQFEHDGIIFRNRERRLPYKNEGYYREWVHPTPQVRGPGPQRIVTGQAGDTWYTPDHYGHFYQVKKP